MPPPPPTSDHDLIAALNLNIPGVEKVKAAVKSGNLSAIQQAYLDYRRHDSTVKWKIMPSNEPAQAKASSDAIGDEILQHHIRNKYGFMPQVVDMGQDFNWQFNPTPRADPGFSNEWTYCAVSRTEFWKTLADAYWKTHDEKYAVEWVAEMKDFAAKNPVGADSYLWRTLDASERVFDSWPYCYFHFLNSPSFTPEANWLYLKLMRDHAGRLYNGLQNKARTGNWITAECSGLYTIATLYPELTDSSSWSSFSVDRLMAEFDRMVPPDGFEDELTPNYHVFALNGFLGPLQLAKLNGRDLPPVFQDKIMSMYRALVLVMNQKGDVPTTNDSIGYNARRTSMDGLKVADDPLLQWAAGNGKSGTAPPDSTMLPYAGFYAMRSGWKPDDFYPFFAPGPTGSRHYHEAMLQILLYAFGEDLALDPWPTPYDHSEWRRYGVGTSSHNTIIVDGKGQHRGPSPVPAVGPLTNPWVTTPLFDYVAGTYDKGYQASVYDPNKGYSPFDWVGQPDTSVSHTRRIVFLKPYYALLLDTLDGTGKHTFESHFNLPGPRAKVDAATQAVFSENSGDVHLGLYPLERQNLTTAVIAGQKNPTLGWIPGTQKPIPTVRFCKEQEAPAIFATVLYPYRGAAPAFDARPLAAKGDGLWGQTLTSAMENAEILLAKDGLIKDISYASTLVGPVSAKAAGLLVRQDIASGKALIGGWGIQAYADTATAFTTDVPGTLVLRSQGGHILMFNGGDALKVTLTKPFTRAVTLPPNTWTDISSDQAQAAATPALFALEAEPEIPLPLPVKAIDLLTNGNFESPLVATGTSVNGFHVAAAGQTLSGWQDLGPTQATSGVQNKAAGAADGDQYAFVRGGDSGAFQIVNYQLKAGDQVTLTWQAESTYKDGTQSVSLLRFASTTSTYTDGGGLATSTDAIPSNRTTDGYGEFVLTYTATAADAGQYVGVSFTNPNSREAGGFTSFDHFTLSVVAAPAQVVAKP